MGHVVFPCVSRYTQSWPGCVCVCVKKYSIYTCQSCAKNLQSCVSVNMYIGIYVTNSRLFAYLGELESMSKYLQR